jgi:integrase/recombinase XerD
MNEKSTRFFKLVRDFLTVYLPEQRAASPNTVKAYREALNLLFEHIYSCDGITLGKVSFDDMTRENIERFLTFIEKERHCSVSTRNHRLACIKSFIKYAGTRDIRVQACVQELNGIPQKKATEATGVPYFSESALKTILEQPDVGKKKGLRDLIFMVLMYDTGARNQELLDLRLCDVHFSGTDPYVTIIGKGKKTRLVPIMGKTVNHLKKYIEVFHMESLSKEYLFYIERNGKRFAMSSDNAERFIRKYGIMAHQVNQEVPESLHPHMFRHSRAMHLYRSGMPLALLSEWLGHAQVTTTLIYVNADTKMKREAIEKATTGLNPLVSNAQMHIEWEDDETIKKLYGLA